MSEQKPESSGAKNLDSFLILRKQRQERAKARLAAVKGNYWYAALVGFKCELDHFDLGALGHLERVKEPPGEIDLAGALKRSDLFGAIGRYSLGISHELAIAWADDSKKQFALDAAWWFTSALRAKSLAQFLVPAVSDCSWSNMVGVTDNTCVVQMLEDVPRAMRLGPDEPIESADLTWTDVHLRDFASLLQEPSFHMAVESLRTHHQQTDMRIATAALWAGIEALFGIEQELRYRLATSIAVLLEPPGPRRLSMYDEVKRAYSTRSKAVHGDEVSNEVLSKHVVQVRALLARLICTITELRHVPTIPELEGRLFGDEGIAPDDKRGSSEG